ncbi:MAG: vWA domain-containing protein [Mariprofundales bacterium]
MLIDVFDHSVRLIQDFTADPHELDLAINSISINPTTANSTRLFGALVEASKRLPAQAYTLNSMVQGQMVLISDAVDNANIETEAEANTAIAGRTLYAIGVGNNVDAAALQRLATTYIAATDFTQVTAKLNQTYDDMDKLAKSLYSFRYSTATQSGLRNVEFGVIANSNTAASSLINGQFDANLMTITAPVELLIKGVQTLAPGNASEMQAVLRNSPTNTIDWAWSLDNTAIANITALPIDASYATLTAQSSGLLNVTTTFTIANSILSATHQLTTVVNGNSVSYELKGSAGTVMIAAQYVPVLQLPSGGNSAATLVAGNVDLSWTVTPKTIIGCAALISCGGGGSSAPAVQQQSAAQQAVATPITQTIAVGSLLPATNYYWKVVVTDPVTGLTADSQVSSFTTQ